MQEAPGSREREVELQGKALSKGLAPEASRQRALPPDGPASSELLKGLTHR